MNSAAIEHSELADRSGDARYQPLSERCIVLDPPHGTPQSIESGAQKVMGSLTVRQSVLERVDAVQNDDTWKGDLSEHRSTGGGSVRQESGKPLSTQFQIMRINGRFEYAYRQRRRGSSGWLWTNASVSGLLRCHRIPADRDSRLTYPAWPGTSFRGETLWEIVQKQGELGLRGDGDVGGRGEVRFGVCPVRDSLPL